MTTTDYVSSISLLPTIEFLEAIAQKQFNSGVNFGVGFSTITPLFFSTTNSEWLCLNSEAEFLVSPQGTAAINNPFSYTRSESSPVFVALDDVSVSPNKINNAKSLFLFREIGTKTEVIAISNYEKTSDNVTTAPPLDCFSRECLSWFPSTTEYFFGFGSMAGSLNKLIVDDNGIILTKSEDILGSMISGSTQPCPHSNIQVMGTVSTLTPFVTIQLASPIEYSGDDFNLLFLYDSNSIAAFVCQFEDNQTEFNCPILLTEVRWNNYDLVIV